MESDQLRPGDSVAINAEGKLVRGDDSSVIMVAFPPIREYAEQEPVEIKVLEPRDRRIGNEPEWSLAGHREQREVIHAVNEGGYNCTLVDLEDVIGWCRVNRPHLIASRPIPVGERLPKEDERVLSYDIENDCWDFSRYHKGEWRTAYPWSNCDGGQKGNIETGITHWLPLPPKPE